MQIAANDSEMASMEATTDQNRLRELIESIPKKQDLPVFFFTFVLFLKPFLIRYMC